MIKTQSQIVFMRNRAKHYGGALYVHEPTPKITLHLHHYKITCFFQVSSKHLYKNASLMFTNNTDHSVGDILYGGWVDFYNCTRTYSTVSLLSVLSAAC